MNAVTKKEINKPMIEEAVRNILLALGQDVDNDANLKETPKRVAKMYSEIYEGVLYTNEEIAIMYDKGFPLGEDEDGDSAYSKNYDEFVCVKNIRVYSTCSHHLVPMILDVAIAYVPTDKVVGLSKMPRIAKMVGRRPQLQEQIGKDIAEVMSIITGSDDVAVLISGRHMCVEMRGVNETHSVTDTAYFGGKFKTDRDLRKELLMCVQK